MLRTFVLVLVLAVAVPAAASDRFADVPSDAPWHGATSRLAEAGVAAGCTDTRFCPDHPVARRQMALFLDRVAGRSVSASSAGGFAPAASGGGLGATPVTVTITSGGTPGGTGRVVLDGSVTVLVDGDVTACPCEVEAFVYRVSDDAKGQSVFGVLPASQPGGTASVTLPVTWGPSQPTATDETYAIGVFVNGASPGGASAQGTLTATWTPYR